MNAQQFFQLTPVVQQQCLYLSGEIIAEIEKEDVYTSLFLVNDFYVEAFLCKKSAEVISIIPQEDPDVQLAYLNKLNIDISGLVN